MTISPGAEFAGTLTVESGVMSLARLLQGTLDRVVSVYAAAGVSLPERQYYTLGQAAADCEQLVVVFSQAYVGPPGDQAASPQRCGGPKTAALSVQVTRSIPTMSSKGRPPTPEQIQTASEVLAVDAYLLLDCANALEQWDAEGGYGLGVIATVNADAPQGGFQSVTMSISMAIP